MGVLPTALTVLTAIATNAQNITAGPFMAAIPTPPSMAWAPLTPTAPTPTAPSIRSRPPPPAHRRPDDRRSPIERPKSSGGGPRPHIHPPQTPLPATPFAPGSSQTTPFPAEP